MSYILMFQMQDEAQIVISVSRGIGNFSLDIVYLITVSLYIGLVLTF